MARTPRDEVAATKTITMRVTEANKARFERQIEARAAELPERTMAALLLRLVQDSEEGGLLKLPAEDRALLEGIVNDRAEELRRLGVSEAESRVTPASVIVGLIRDAAKARGIAAATVASAPHATESPPAPRTAEPPAKVSRKRAAPVAGASVHAALVAALESGATQADIARRAGIDPGQLNRFKQDKARLSPERLAKVAAALKSST